jgi:hypothetical protein
MRLPLGVAGVLCRDTRNAAPIRSRRVRSAVEKFHTSRSRAVHPGCDFGRHVVISY